MLSSYSSPYGRSNKRRAISSPVSLSQYRNPLTSLFSPTNGTFNGTSTTLHLQHALVAPSLQRRQPPSSTLVQDILHNHVLKFDPPTYAIENSIEERLLVICVNKFIRGESLPTIENIIEMIHQSPLESTIVTNGTKKLDNNINHLLQLVMELTDKIDSDTSQVNSMMERFQSLTLARVPIFEAYVTAKTNVEEANKHVDRLRTLLATKEADLNENKVLHAVCDLLAQVMGGLTTKPFSFDVGILEVRKLFGVEEWITTRSLTAVDCQKILQSLFLLGFQNTNFFQGLWRFPPGLTVDKWIQLYGRVPEIILGCKTGQYTIDLQDRVAAYLGLIPPDGVSADASPSDAALEESPSEAALEKAKLMKLPKAKRLELLNTLNALILAEEEEEDKKRPATDRATTTATSP